MYRKEADVPITIYLEDVEKAVCGSPMYCTLAQAGARELGSEMKVLYDIENTGHVRISWKDEDNRRHRGYLTPDHLAISILMLTDYSKRKLIRKFKAGEEFNLTVEEHQSRPDYKHKEAEYRKNKEKRDELRAAGLLPPAVPRKKPRAKSAIPRIGVGVRMVQPVKPAKAS